MRLVRMGEIVPDGIAMGHHLFHGNFGGKHFVEPRDMAPMVELAYRVSGGMGWSIDWIHILVPTERDDEPYFKALKGLRLENETGLYLGLVHDQDGEDSCRRRMATADKFIQHHSYKILKLISLSWVSRVRSASKVALLYLKF